MTPVRFEMRRNRATKAARMRFRGSSAAVLKIGGGVRENAWTRVPQLRFAVPRVPTATEFCTGDRGGYAFGASGIWLAVALRVAAATQGARRLNEETA